jgi:sporulation protein YlmC with PRC-barrel domain
MKTSLICGAALAILGVAAAPLIAQTQTTAPSTEANYVQTSKVIGTKVKTAQGEEIGVVKDVVLERSNGCLAYTVLSTGGGGSRITGQSKLVAVPWSVYTVSPDASYLTVNIERDRIYNAPVFEYSRISDAAYISNVYSHFNVSAGVSNTTMTGATTATTGATTGTTGSTTQTQGGAAVSPTASPGASASVSPGASASPSVSASAAPSATVSPSASADAKASASPKSGSTGRGKSGESQTSSRHKGDETTQGTSGESTSEATGNSSGKKSSTRKSTSGESSAESENTPSSKKSSHKKGSSEGTSETAPTPGGEQE